jgi:hypothetical protein
MVFVFFGKFSEIMALRYHGFLLFLFLPVYSKTNTFQLMSFPRSSSSKPINQKFLSVSAMAAFEYRER